MNNQPGFDRELLIPIVVGGLSVVGIIVVLLVGRSLNAPAEVPATPSSTPFQYVYLGTEPAITTLVVDGSELPPTEEPFEEEPDNVFPPPATSTRPAVATPIILTQPNTTGTPTGISRTSTPSRTPTGNTTAPANTYDDTVLTYTGSWVSLTGVDGAYQETLHISNTTGNTVTFTFTGTEIHVFYQSGPTSGTMTITIDSLGDPPISQQSTTQIKEWVSDTLSSGTHTVVIAHSGGGSINIDRLYIPAPTPTPTRTPTP
jgi:hypothetical protein